MRKAQLPAAPMADLLLGMQGEKGAGDDKSPAWTSLLSSHPQTPERARKLKQGEPEGC
jgi:Zn-dependent protease with chaperone function